jgi:hypothetical protein
VAYRDWDHFEWWVPQEGESHHYVQIAATRARGWRALRFRAYYWSIVRWIFHGQFNDEDRLMVDVMDAPPERLYRPDKAIIGWREMGETQLRQPAGREAVPTAGVEEAAAADGAGPKEEDTGDGQRVAEHAGRSGPDVRRGKVPDASPRSG